MDYNRITVFCDYGLDDAIATLHILDNADMFGAIDIVPVGGNVDVFTAYRNAHTLLAAAGADGSKVRIVDTREIVQGSADIPDVHGVDGIGDVLKAAQSGLTVVKFDEYKAELTECAVPHRDCVLSLGPCTVPNMLGYVPFCTIVMGGTTKEPPNYGGYEFNEALDLKAFKALAFDATAVATLDTCHNAGIDFADIGKTELARKMINRYIELCKARNAPVAVYDYVAALAVTHPQLFSAQRIRRSDGVEYNELSLSAVR